MRKVVLLITILCQLVIANAESVSIISNSSSSSSSGTLHRFGFFDLETEKPNKICLRHQEYISSATYIQFDEYADPCGEVKSGYMSYIPHFIPKRVEEGNQTRIYTLGSCPLNSRPPIKKRISKTELDFRFNIESGSTDWIYESYTFDSEEGNEILRVTHIDKGQKTGVTLYAITKEQLVTLHKDSVKEKLIVFYVIQGVPYFVTWQEDRFGVPTTILYEYKDGKVTQFTKFREAMC